MLFSNRPHSMVVSKAAAKFSVQLKVDVVSFNVPPSLPTGSLFVVSVRLGPVAEWQTSKLFLFFDNRLTAASAKR